MKPIWHSVTASEALEALGGRATGLTEGDAAERRARYGLNELPTPPGVSALQVLGAQLNSMIVFLLIAAIVVSLLFDDRLEAAAIGAVLVINTIIGFVTEFRARRAMEALITLDLPHALVLRDGTLRALPARDLVPGDVVALETGRQVPADGRLIEAVDLRVDEAPLTGESMPISKTASASLATDTLLGDRVTMAYLGTAVAGGLGRIVVTATGQSTEVGRIGVLTSGVQLERTPLERRLDALGRRLVWMTLGVAAVVAALGLYHGLPLDAVIETSIALAIAAVPEALPAVATIALAVGVHRMARRHALVRRLPAVESLGSTTVVCTDKTRTLTSGEMAVVRIWASGIDTAEREADAGSQDATRRDGPVRKLLEAAALASRAQAEVGPGAEAARVDPVDRAVLNALERAGLTRDALLASAPESGLVPFSSERKYMASFHEGGERPRAFVKGAPRAVLDLCAWVETSAGARPLDEAARAALTAVNDRFAGDGLRVLAVASGDAAEASASGLTGLTFLGVIGLADPPAPGVKETIGRLRAAGLRTVMLTGDQRLTAESVGRALGVIDVNDHGLDGRELDNLEAAAIGPIVASHAVFSRITPEHKLTVVRALQAQGEIVAMLGDGVNDAAALKQADVGVAMGVRGTDVAKRAAAIVLQDDRFETIAAAVEEGRVIFDNIRKFVFYLFSCNVAEILVLLGAGVAGLPLPLLPLQLLWLNLVTDTFPALALALEPAEGEVMQRPPRRPEEAILSRRFLGTVLLYAAMITAVTLAAFVWALNTAPERASTMAFMTLAVAQTLHLGNARSHRAVLGWTHMTANPFAIGGVVLSILLQMAAAWFAPLAALLGVTPLLPREWAVAIGLAVLPAVIGQVLKIVSPRR